MVMPRGNFLLLALSAAMAATPALAQHASPVLGKAGTAGQSAASLPELSRLWANTLGPGFPPPASGPGPVLNRARQRAAVDIYGRDIDPANAPIVSAGGRRVGDYTAPILQPWAAEVVKEHAEKELNDGPALNPINQCRPGGVPFAFYNLGMELLQQRNSIVILYAYDHEVRHVRLNQAHPANLTPSWFGDSVGHYEGDTLVIDTIASDTRTFIDQFDTPHTERLHTVERYRMTNGGKTLEVNLHVEDPGAFTTPWDAMQRYKRVEPGVADVTDPFNPLSATSRAGPILEASCAENPNSLLGAEGALPIPQTKEPDF
jgi:hypothetical protein